VSTIGKDIMHETVNKDNNNSYGKRGIRKYKRRKGNRKGGKRKNKRRSNRRRERKKRKRESRKWRSNKWKNSEEVDDGNYTYYDSNSKDRNLKGGGGERRAVSNHKNQLHKQNAESFFGISKEKATSTIEDFKGKLKEVAKWKSYLDKAATRIEGEKHAEALNDLMDVVEDFLSQLPEPKNIPENKQQLWSSDRDNVRSRD